MRQYEDKTEAFIIRIWIEPREFQDAPVVWRGEIEHVSSHGRHFFNDLSKIADLIRPYLVRMGISPYTLPPEN